MSDNKKLIEQLNEAIGGEWKATAVDAPLKGYSANFPQFRSDAIVGVVNAAASQAGARERAVSFSIDATSNCMASTPDAQREVVIPAMLAKNSQFCEQLTQDMRQTITATVSQQLSYGASQGLNSR